MQQKLVVNCVENAERTIQGLLEQMDPWHIVSFSMISHEGKLWLAAILERESGKTRAQERETRSLEERLRGVQDLGEKLRREDEP